MELHGFENRVSRLIVAYPGMQLRKLWVILPALSNVPKSPEHDHTVAEHQPSECSCWTLEYLAEVQEVLGTWARHHVNEQQWHTGWLPKEGGGVLTRVIVL